ENGRVSGNTSDGSYSRINLAADGQSSRDAASQSSRSSDSASRGATTLNGRTESEHRLQTLPQSRSASTATGATELSLRPRSNIATRGPASLTPSDTIMATSEDYRTAT